LRRIFQEGSDVEMKTIVVVVSAMGLAACGKSPDDAAPAAASSPATAEPAPAAKSAGGDPCTLVADPAATFGQAVTTESTAMPHGARTCEWKSADGRICGSLTVFGPGWFEQADPKTNLSGMATSLAAFGEVNDLAGIGEEAKAVDGGMLGAQIAFRTSKVAALVASSCNEPLTQAAQAEKLAREVAGLL
jgi:hypothetical protein